MKRLIGMMALVVGFRAVATTSYGDTVLEGPIARPTAVPGVDPVHTDVYVVSPARSRESRMFSVAKVLTRPR